MKAIFAQEDDVYRQESRLIERIPDVSERLEKQIQLTAFYLYGAKGTPDDPEGWIGLSGRAKLYEQWAQIIPEKANQYLNNARDITAKIQLIEPELAQMVNYYENANGVLTTDEANALLGAVKDTLPSELQIPAGLEGKYGIMVTTDDLGREYEKIIPLNSQIMETDAAGMQTAISTKVGTDIAQIKDSNGQTKYIKLNPVWASGDDPSFDKPAFYQGQYEGKYYVKDPYAISPELQPASDVTENPDIQIWYQSVKPQEQAAMSNYMDVLQKTNPQKYQQKMAEAPIQKVKSVTTGVQTEGQPESRVDILKPATLPTPKEVPIPAQTFQAPADAFKTPLPIRLDQEAQIPSNIQFKDYKPQIPLPSPAFSVPIQADINRQQMQYERLKSPDIKPTPIQNLGMNVNLGPKAAPPIPSPQSPQKINFFSGIKNFFSNLFKPRKKQWNISIPKKLRI